MSLTVVPVAVIGIQIDRNSLYQIKREKAFEHNYADDSDFQFDPKTGKSLWYETKTPISDYDDSDSKLCGFQIYTGRQDVCVVGFAATEWFYAFEDKTNHRFMSEELAAAALLKGKVALKEALGKLGLWDETKFGLYCICSVW